MYTAEPRRKDIRGLEVLTLPTLSVSIIPAPTCSHSAFRSCENGAHQVGQNRLSHNSSLLDKVLAIPSTTDAYVEQVLVRQAHEVDHFRRRARTVRQNKR